MAFNCMKAGTSAVSDIGLYHVCEIGILEVEDYGVFEAFSDPVQC